MSCSQSRTLTFFSWRAFVCTANQEGCSVGKPAALFDGPSAVPFMIDVDKAPPFWVTLLNRTVLNYASS